MNPVDKILHNTDKKYDDNLILSYYAGKINYKQLLKEAKDPNYVDRVIFFD